MDSLPVILSVVVLGTLLLARWLPGPKPPASTEERAELDAQLDVHLSAGRKIEAIKVHRRLTGMGLKESKEAIEALLRERQQRQPH